MENTLSYFPETALQDRSAISAFSVPSVI